MAFKIHTTAGNTEQVAVLRKQITEALNKHTNIEVYLLQPGIMWEDHNKRYFEESTWLRCLNFYKDL
jgi:hypothetical protein